MRSFPVPPAARPAPLPIALCLALAAACLALPAAAQNLPGRRFDNDPPRPVAPGTAPTPASTVGTDPFGRPVDAFGRSTDTFGRPVDNMGRPVDPLAPRDGRQAADPARNPADPADPASREAVRRPARPETACGLCGTVRAIERDNGSHRRLMTDEERADAPLRRGWIVTLRMEDGLERRVPVAREPWDLRPGDRVRLVEGRILPRGRLPGDPPGEAETRNPSAAPSPYTSATPRPAPPGPLQGGTLDRPTGTGLPPMR